MISTFDLLSKPSPLNPCNQHTPESVAQNKPAFRISLLRSIPAILLRRLRLAQ